MSWRPPWLVQSSQSTNLISRILYHRVHLIYCGVNINRKWRFLSNDDIFKYFVKICYTWEKIVHLGTVNIDPNERDLCKKIRIAKWWGSFKTYTAIQTSSKGQLISKGLFGIFNSPKKLTKKINFTTMVSQVELFLFVFWEN